jgi:hypothetical protein
VVYPIFTDCGQYDGPTTSWLGLQQYQDNEVCRFTEKASEKYVNSISVDISTLIFKTLSIQYLKTEFLLFILLKVRAT